MRSEFQFIEDIKSKYGLAKVGDDCAVLPKDDRTDLLVTADLLVENVDFRLAWTSPEFLGHKALAVSLSDIAAMGGQPKWALLSIGVPQHLWKTDFLDYFYEGWFALARKYGLELVGGDVSRSEAVVIDSMVGGETPAGRAILRSGTKPGDRIFVSGSLGGAAGGLRLLENGSRYAQKTSKAKRELMLKQLKPQPQLEVAKLLQTHGIAAAMIDLSDGLSSDLAHLCKASNLGAQIRFESLPIDPSLALHFSADEWLEMALHGGEDFGLLFTVTEENTSNMEIDGISCIGVTTANPCVIELIDGGETTILEPQGYRHF